MGSVFGANRRHPNQRLGHWCDSVSASGAVYSLTAAVNSYYSGTFADVTPYLTIDQNTGVITWTGPAGQNYAQSTT